MPTVRATTRYVLADRARRARGHAVRQRLVQLESTVTFPRDAVVTIEQVAFALGVSVSTVEKMDLPVITCGKAKLRRYRWGLVLDTLDERARDARPPLRVSGRRRRKAGAA